MTKLRTLSLIPPRISQDHIKKKITCIRAHRERIFKLSAEVESGKLLCHNFGQGGAGWTFLFGCVNRSIELFNQSVADNPEFKRKPIAVIGAGCYGLLTAILLARAGHTVRIIAKQTEQLPSHRAAGFFFPGARRRSNPAELKLFKEIGIDSYRTYLQIIQGEHPFIGSGPKIIPAYYGLEINPGFEDCIQQKLVPSPEKVQISFGTEKTYDAMEYQMLFINPTEIMQELQKTVAQLAIPIIKNEISSFEQVEEHIVFNCSGLGSKELVNNSRIVPVQGHLITLKNQPPADQMNYLINAQIQRGDEKPEFVYYAPKEEGILGITFLRGKKSLQANEHEFDRLIERSRYFFGE